jgi:fimbrial isopeptide formation D2 family protein
MASCAYPSTLRLDKNVVARVHDDDQFGLTIQGGAPAGIAVSETTSGSALGIQAAHAGPVVGVADVVYTLSESAAGTTNLADYNTTYVCRDVTNPSGGPMASGIGTSVTLTYPEPSGQEIVCTFTNTPRVGVVKDVDDTAKVRLGDTVDWTITGGIPAGDIDGYRITDKIDTTKLTLDDSTGVQVALSSGTPPLALSTAGGPGDYTRSYSGGLLSITFTATGLGKLEAAAAASSATTVVVTVTTTVDAVGVIENSALVYQNEASFTVLPGQPNGPVPSEPVATKWGSVLIQKQNSAGVPLSGLAAGATFQLYATNPATDPAARPIEIGGDGDAATTGDGGISSWTVNPTTGEFTITGLRYSDWEDGAPIADPANWQHYWLVETKAPQGFELLGGPFQFDLTAGNDTEVITIANPVGVKEAVHNAGFVLPFTGGPGTWWWTTIALLLLALALLATDRTVASRRRRH